MMTRAQLDLLLVISRIGAKYSSERTSITPLLKAVEAEEAEAQAAFDRKVMGEGSGINIKNTPGMSRNPAPDMMQDIRDFHEKYQLAYDGLPRMLPHELQTFRVKFMDEELTEYNDAWTSDVDTEAEKRDQKAKAFDALVDLVYVALGTAYLHGFDFYEAWRRVHHANMQKVRAERIEQSTRQSKFDVVKPPGWAPPSYEGLV